MRIAIVPILLLAIAARGQNVLFEENFDQGIPPGWTQIQRGWTHDAWRPGRNPATNDPDVFHEYFCNHGTLFRDNMLVTPPIDLRGFTAAVFRCDEYQVLPTWRLLNRIEIAAGGGAFVPVHTVTGSIPGPGVITVDLVPFLGQADVRIGFRYQGDIANEWRIDNVRVTTPQPLHTITGLAAGGVATFAVRGVAPGNLVLIGLSLTGPGPLPAPFGTVALTPPVDLLSVVFAGPAGTVGRTLSIPIAAAGLRLWSQGAELLPDDTLRWSNALARTVQ